MLIGSLIILQIFVFSGLVFLFRRIMTQNVTSATKHLEDLNQDYEDKEKNIVRQLEDAKQKAQEIIDRARDEAEKLKSKIVNDVEKEKETILQQSRVRSEEIIQQADKSRQLLVSELHQRVKKEAINKACELIQNTLPEKFRQEVHSHWIEELIENGFSQLERLRVPEEIQEIMVTSAFPLEERQSKVLIEKLTMFLKRDIVIKEETNPGIVAGVIVVIGSLIMDGSLKNKIQEQAKDINAGIMKNG